MKPLKTWQIVLLVIFYPVGICVLIYRLVKKSKLKKEAEARSAEREAAAQSRAEAEARREAERKAAYEAERAAEYKLDYKIVGVTFKNPDGKSRQSILQKMYFNKPPFNKPDGYEITVEDTEYDGKLAYSVFADGLQIGNIGKDDISCYREHSLDFVRVEGASIYGGGTDEDGNALNYGITIHCLYRKRS